MATFHLELPDMDDEEISMLAEVLQNDIEGFDEIEFKNGSADNHNNNAQPPPPQMFTTTVETQVSDVTQMSMAVTKEPKMPNNDPRVVTVSMVHRPRFKEINTEELLELEQNQYSVATKRNTKWGTGALCLERFGQIIDLKSVSKQELNENLRKFYAEVQPKYLNQRPNSMPELQAAEYHKNSLKNVRAALNRRLKDLGINFDIVKDSGFKTATAMFNAKLKCNLKNGLSRPTKNHDVISESDLSKINTYLKFQKTVALRFKVWYLLAVHFISRSCEFLPQLMISSLKFEKDENNKEFITIAHETLQKNHQGGLNAKTEEAQDKRMYETGSENCPIKTVRYFLSKCDPNAKPLFNQCVKGAVRSFNPEAYDVWYTCEPVKAKAFTQFMPDICKNAGTVLCYTAHSLRSTVITAMSDAGFPDRSIMFMSDHKCKQSLKNYCRRPSTTQKEMISNVLEKVASGMLADKNLPLVSDKSVIPAATGSAFAPLVMPLPNRVLAMNQQEMWSSQMSSFATNSSFNNCHFHLYSNNSNTGS